MAVECVHSESKRRRMAPYWYVCALLWFALFSKLFIHLYSPLTSSFSASFPSSVFSFLQSPSTCLLGLSVLRSLQLCAQAALSHEALYWLLHNTATVAYSIAQKLMSVGMAKDVSKFSNQIITDKYHCNTIFSS